MAQYTSLLSQVAPEWDERPEEGRQPRAKGGMGPVFSSLAAGEEAAGAEEATVSSPPGLRPCKSLRTCCPDTVGPRSKVQRAVYSTNHLRCTIGARLIRPLVGVRCRRGSGLCTSWRVKGTWRGCGGCCSRALPWTPGTMPAARRCTSPLTAGRWRRPGCWWRRGRTWGRGTTRGRPPCTMRPSRNKERWVLGNLSTGITIVWFLGRWRRCAVGRNAVLLEATGAPAAVDRC